jgi:hypothetical protein
MHVAHSASLVLLVEGNIPWSVNSPIQVEMPPYFSISDKFPVYLWLWESWLDVLIVLIVCYSIVIHGHVQREKKIFIVYSCANVALHYIYYIYLLIQIIENCIVYSLTIDSLFFSLGHFEINILRLNERSHKMKKGPNLGSKCYKISLF